MTPLPTLVQLLRLDDTEYFPTPQANRGLQALNSCIVQYSPVRFQLNQPISEVAKSTSSYIKRKSKEVVETALECIAPGQSSELLTRITQPSPTKEPSTENKIIANLVLFGI